jgi:carboxyl-terminal processing protease
MQKVFPPIIFCFILGSCKTNEINTIESTFTELDSVYSICKDVYFWSENLPNYNQEQLQNFQTSKILFKDLKTHSEFHNGKPLDRWSFVIDKESWQKLQQNQADGFGFDMAFASDEDLRIKVVYDQSNAYKQGLRRGFKILKINDIVAINSNKDLLSNEMKKANISLEFLNQKGIVETIILQTSTFRKNPLINTRILESKTGYFYFDIFFGGNSIYSDFDRLFTSFQKENIKDLIVDLRYNHGGDGVMALSMANSIIPETANGKIFSRVINNNKYKLLNYSLFLKATVNNLNLKRVFFITSPETASSSEILINALSAVMDVKIIGTSTNGKPFGFQPYPIGNYYIFPVSFKNVNAKGFGEFYDGLPVDYEVADDLTKDFGDTEEECLKSVLTYIRTGQFPLPKKKNRQASKSNPSINEQEIPNIFYYSKAPF